MQLTLPKVMLAAAAIALTASQAHATEATFDRNLAVGPHPELRIANGSGNVHLHPSADAHIHIFGKVHSNGGLFGSGDNDSKVAEIAAHPPIEQTGDIVRVGRHEMNLHNISIDYEIEAPAGTILDASTGSGDIRDDGVGRDVKLNSGSGNIHAEGLAGVSASTGSGDIYAALTGAGDVKAETGSGNIELKGIRGGFHGQTGSGNIKAQGTPTSGWDVHTGSGNAELWTGDAPLTLDASTGSGNVNTAMELTTQGTHDRHHVVGKIHGGGPLVHVDTGSGNIDVR